MDEKLRKIYILLMPDVQVLTKYIHQSRSSSDINGLACYEYVAPACAVTVRQRDGASEVFAVN